MSTPLRYILRLVSSQRPQESVRCLHLWRSVRSYTHAAELHQPMGTSYRRQDTSQDESRGTAVASTKASKWSNNGQDGDKNEDSHSFLVIEICGPPPLLSHTLLFVMDPLYAPLDGSDSEDDDDDSFPNCMSLRGDHAITHASAYKSIWQLQEQASQTFGQSALIMSGTEHACVPVALNQRLGECVAQACIAPRDADVDMLETISPYGGGQKRLRSAIAKFLESNLFQHAIDIDDVIVVQGIAAAKATAVAAIADADEAVE